MKPRHGEHRVGDTYWFVSTIGDNRRYEVTVTKVGRKYLHLDNDYTAEKDSSAVVERAFGRVGTLYESKEAYQDHIAHLEAWRKLRDFFSRQYQPPAELSLQQMQEIANIVGYDFAEGA